MTRNIVLGIYWVLIISLCSVWSQSWADDEEFSEILVGDELRYVEVGSDSLWFATGKGVSRYNIDAKSWDSFTSKDGLISNKVNCIAIEWKEGVFRKNPSQRVWFGTDSGLSVYDMKDNSWQSYTVKDGLIANKIKCISARRDWIWVGTQQGASAYQRKKDRWQSYSTFSGIASPSVTAIYHDSAYVWIGTNNGLGRFNYKYKKWEHFTRQSSSWIGVRGGNRGVARSPLPSEQIYDIKGSGDVIYVATGNGLVRVTNKKFRSGVDLARADKAYSKLKSPQKYNADLRTRSRRLSRGANAARLRAAEAEYSRAQKSFSRNEMDAWAALGWQIYQPSKVVQDREKRGRISDRILALQISAGQVWMATNTGLLKFDSKMQNWDWHHQEMGLVSDRISSLGMTGNTIWIATNHGLSKFGTLSGKWINYAAERTLPSANVLAVGEDTSGVWLATPKAISLFNPNTERWKTYTNEEGLGGGRVACLDVVGNYVWIGTDQGISRFDKSDETWTYFQAAKSGLVADEITTTLVDGKHIWIGTHLGLNRYENTTGEWRAFSTRLGLAGDRINDLAADPSYVWVGTEKGLSRYSKSDDSWNTISELGEVAVLAIARNDGKLAVSTERGIYLHDDGLSWRQLQIKPERPSDTIVLDGELLWLGGWRHLEQYDIQSGQTRKFTEEDAQGLSRVRVHDIKNSLRYIWVATDGGIYRYNKTDNTWWSYAPGRERGATEVLADRNILAIAVGDEFLFVGTPRGISRYDKITDSWLNYTPKDGLIHHFVSSLAWDGEFLWAGTHGGLSRYSLGTDRWTNFTRVQGLCDNRINAIAEDENVLWIATQGGVSRYDTRAGTWRTFTTDDGLPHNIVWAVAVDDDKVWIGTNNGAARYRASEGKWRIYTTVDGLINNVVNSISVEDKYIFLTTPAGVTIYDKEVGSLSPYSRKDGLIASEAKSIGSKEKYHWIGTVDGITLYNQITDLSRDFTVTEGLPSNNIQVVAVDGDEIWFGTDAGLARHHWRSGIWTVYSEAPTEVASTSLDLMSNNVKSVISDGDNLWVGTRVGLARYDKILHTWHVANLGYDPLRSTENAQTVDLKRAVDNTVEAVEEALQATSPTTEQKVYVEYDPVVAQEKAVQALHQVIIQKTPMPNDPIIPSPFLDLDITFPPSPVVRVIEPILGTLWIGTEAGVIIYNKAHEQVIKTHPLLPWVREIKYHQGRTWVLCDDMIAIRDLKADSWVLISGRQVVEQTRARTSVGYTEKIETASEDWGIVDCTAMTLMDNQIWIGRENGLKILKVDFPQFEFASEINIPEYLQEAEITALDFDGRDTWIGTRNGLFQYHSETSAWRPYTILNGLAGNEISAITAGDKSIWVGTAGEGLSRYDKSAQEWASFRFEDGLADNNIRSIALDGKYIWIGTFSAGICRYDLTTELWTTYQTADQLARR